MLFRSVSQDLLFEYTQTPPMLTLSPVGAQRLGLEEATVDPYHNKQVQAIISSDQLAELAHLLQNTTPEEPVVEYDCTIQLNGQLHPVHIISRAMWSSEEPPQYTGAVGKVIER